MYYILYILFFIASLLYGSLYIGPVTPRQLMTVLMLGYLLVHRKLFIDKYLKWYFVFILMFVISSIFGGYTIRVLRDVFSLHFVGLVGYIATVCLLQRERGKKVLYWTIIAIGVFNSLITISQLLHWNIATEVINTLHLADGYSAFMENHTNYEVVEDAFIFALPGIFPDAAINGCFASVAAIASLWLLMYYRKAYLSVITLFLMAGCFATQQRTAFIGALGCVLLLYWIYFKYEKTSAISRFFPVLLIIALFVFIQSPIDIVTRYDDLFDMESRTNVYQQSLDFISKNLAFGGFYDFVETYNKYPHNLILNAFIIGGLFGAVSIFVIVGKHLVRCLDIFKKLPTNITAMVPVCIIINMICASLFHNQSIVFGDFLYWCMAAFIVIYEGQTCSVDNKLTNTI